MFICQERAWTLQQGREKKMVRTDQGAAVETFAQILLNSSRGRSDLRSHLLEKAPVERVIISLSDHVPS